MLTRNQIIFKRSIDLMMAIIGLFLFSWLIVFLIIIVFFFTGESGFFCQKRVGQFGEVFRIYKIKSIHDNNKLVWFSKLIRKSKLDELPQLWNVLIGDMSIVGPRPDLEGFADQLQGDERIILNLKPGLTGPASLYFYNEEELLNQQENKEWYNREVIWKKKVDLNLNYINNYSLYNDIKYIIKTFTRLVKY